MTQPQVPINKNTIIIASAIIIATVILAALIILSVSVQVHNTGTINTIGFTLWADQNRTTVLSSINWGTFNPGDIHGVVGWAQNTQTVNLTLSFQLYNWTPSTAPQYLIFSWNYTGSIIVPGQVLPIQMNLWALANVTGITTFSFDINMTATQA